MTETRTHKQIAADKLAELIEKLEKAEGPSKELDALVARVAGWHRVEPRFTTNRKGGWISPADFIGVHGDGSPILDSLHGTDIHRDPPPVTASLDAAVALAERVLPGWRWGVIQGNTPEDDFQGNVWPGVQPYPADLDMFGYHKSAHLALCLAILKAVRAHMHPRDREETNQ